MEIFDFNVVEEDRNRKYAGMAGQKLGIKLNNENWFLKFPKNTSNLNNVEISYTTMPISEYVGSQIYQSIGIETHQTVLGIKDNKVVVACKDFLEPNERLDEFKAIKNDYVEGLEEELQNLSSSSGNGTDLEEIMLIMQKNPLFIDYPQLKDRFWDMFVVDSLIGNNDRNNGNWGVIINTIDKKRRIAPVYDNGNCFNNKLSENQIKDRLYNEEKFKNIAYNSSGCIFRVNEKLINPLKYIEKMENQDLNNAICRVFPKINMKNISSIINEIPNEFKGIQITSNTQKEFYIKLIEYRYENVFQPVYEEIMKRNNIKENIILKKEISSIETEENSEVEDEAEDEDER